MIANTNPNTFEENLYINPIRMKSKGMRPAMAQRAVSEACFSDIDKIDKDFDMLVTSVKRWSDKQCSTSSDLVTQILLKQEDFVVTFSNHKK